MAFLFPVPSHCPFLLPVTLTPSLPSLPFSCSPFTIPKLLPSLHSPFHFPFHPVILLPLPPLSPFIPSFSFPLLSYPRFLVHPSLSPTSLPLLLPSPAHSSSSNHPSSLSRSFHSLITSYIRCFPSCPLHLSSHFLLPVLPSFPRHSWIPLSFLTIYLLLYICLYICLFVVIFISI